MSCPPDFTFSWLASFCSFQASVLLYRKLSSLMLLPHLVIFNVCLCSHVLPLPSLKNSQCPHYPIFLLLQTLSSSPFSFSPLTVSFSLSPTTPHCTAAVLWGVTVSPAPFLNLPHTIGCSWTNRSYFGCSFFPFVSSIYSAVHGILSTKKHQGKW